MTLTVGNVSERFKHEERALPRPSPLQPVFVYPVRARGGLTLATHDNVLNMSPQVTSSGEGGHLARLESVVTFLELSGSVYASRCPGVKCTLRTRNCALLDFLVGGV